MNEDPIPGSIREILWRQKRTSSEQAELDAWLRNTNIPNLTSEAQVEVRLTESLAALPDVPVSSNFTARVLQAVKAGQAAKDKRAHRLIQWFPFRMRWLVRATAVVLLGTGFLGYQHVQAARQREFARSVGTVADVATVPSPEILQDFQAIRIMTPSPSPDEQLLAALQMK
jgi:hypothetical protein